MTENEKNVKSDTGDDTSRRDEQKASFEAVSMTMDKRGDLAIAVGTALLGLFILIAARDISEGSIPGPVTSRGLPNILGAFLLIGGVVLAVRQILVWRALPGHLVPEEGQEDEPGHPASWIRAFGIMVASMLSVWLLQPLGYLIVTPLFLFVTSLFMGVRSRAKLVAFPIVFTVPVWAIFDPILGINLPLGVLEPVARSLGIIW